MSALAAWGIDPERAARKMAPWVKQIEEQQLNTNDVEGLLASMELSRLEMDNLIEEPTRNTVCVNCDDTFVVNVSASVARCEHCGTQQILGD